MKTLLALILVALSGLATAQERSVEWVAQKNAAWRKVGVTYAYIMNDPRLKKRFFETLQVWDAKTKAEHPAIYNDPNKPVIYAEWFHKLYQEEASQKMPAEHAAAPSYDWKKNARESAARAMAANAAMEADLEESRKAIEADRAEQRLRDLEQAERDRKHAESFR